MAAGSAVAMIGANLRFGSSAGNMSLNATRVFQCHPGGTAEATLIFTLGTMGMAANLAMMAVILANRQLRRWSQGLLFHQGAVDCARAALLLPLGMSILHCQPVNKCSLVETAFLLLVTVATVNMLTTVLNDSPIFPEDDSEEDRDLADAPLLMDSPQCVLFGTFMIWFASITINLGPTFLSGALAAQGEPGHKTPSCPLIHGPLRHYILNALWIMVNLVCVFLTLFHLRKLHRDLTKANVEAVRVAGLVTTLVNVTGGTSRGASTQGSRTGTLVPGAGGMQNGNAERATGALEEHRRMREYLNRMERDGVQRVKMFLVITAAYVLFWGPLFFVTLVNHPIVGNQLGHEITLHISYVHAIVNPTLFLVLHRGLRRAALDLCCGWVPLWICGFSGGGSSCCTRYRNGGGVCCRGNRVPPPPNPPRPDISLLKTPLPAPAQPDSSMGNAHMSNASAIPNRPWTPEQLSAPILPHHYKKAQSLLMLHHNDLLDDEFIYSETINDELQPILPLLLPLQQQQQRVNDLLERQLIQQRANNVITNQPEQIKQKPILLKQRSFERPRSSYQYGGVQEHILRHKEALSLKTSQETIRNNSSNLVDQQTQFSIDEYTPLLRQFGTPTSGQSGQSPSTPPTPLSVSVMTSPPPSAAIMSPVTSVADSDL